MVNVALEYMLHGLKPIPCKDKIPMIKGWPNKYIAPVEFTFPEIAIQTEINGIEVIDIDNKSDKTKKILSALWSFGTVVSKTRSGGYHLIYRTDYPEKNQKLARTTDGLTIIETRGKNGIIITEPTPGYEVIRGSLFNIPYIPQCIRDEMFELSKSFNEYTSKPIQTYSFDEEKEQDYEGALRLLLAHGWTLTESNRLRRPGKTRGSSATWGFTPIPFVFYVFSSNATPFEANRAYCPNQIFRLLGGRQ